MGGLWTIVLLQTVTTAVLAIGIYVNAVRSRRVQEELTKHRIKLEQSLAHLEDEISQLRVKANGPSS